MAYSASDTVTVAASPQACFDALTDYERLPEWQGALKRVSLLESGPDGDVVEYVLDAKLREVRYKLRLVNEPPHAIRSTYLEGDFRNLAAEWRFADNGDGTTAVTLDIQIDVSRFVPGPVRNLVREAVMNRAMSDLKAYVR